MEQISVRAMNLDRFRAGFQCTASSIYECLHNCCNFIRAHCFGSLVSRIERQSAWGKNRRPPTGLKTYRTPTLPRLTRACLAPTMGQLHPRDCAMLLNETENTGEHF